MTETLIVINCTVCNVVFGFTEAFAAERQESGIPFMCPNGHINRYEPPNSDEHTIMRLQEQIRMQERIIDRKNEVIASLNPKAEYTPWTMSCVLPAGFPSLMALLDADIDTLHDLKKATDQQILAIVNIGPVRLRAIRAAQKALEEA